MNSSSSRGGKPLKRGGVFYIFRRQCQMRHKPKINQWPPISLFLKSLGLGTRPDHHQLKWVKSYDVICEDGGHLGFLYNAIQC